jgi:hypothetical protein
MQVSFFHKLSVPSLSNIANYFVTRSPEVQGVELKYAYKKLISMIDYLIKLPLLSITDYLNYLEENKQKECLDQPVELVLKLRLQQFYGNNLLRQLVSYCRKQFSLLAEYYSSPSKLVETFATPYRLKKFKKLFYFGNVEGVLIEFDDRYAPYFSSIYFLRLRCDTKSEHVLRFYEDPTRKSLLASFHGTGPGRWPVTIVRGNKLYLTFSAITYEILLLKD